MSICERLGNCFKQCFCNCYDDEECEVPSKICSCGHRNHKNLTECDVYYLHTSHLVECHNFKMCGQKRPDIILGWYNGMCMDCAISFGKIKFLDEKDDCPICFDNKDMIEISCGKHKLCLDCWKNWSKTSTQIPLTCPFCRNSIWKGN